MADYPITTVPIFSQTMRQLEPTDPAHAQVFNELIQTLLDNDNFLEALTNKMIQKSMISNDLVTTDNRMVLGAPMGKLLKEQLDEQNNNLGVKLTGILTTGQTSVTIADANIAEDNIVDVYTDKGIDYNSITVTDGSIVLEFDAQEADTVIKVEVR